MSISHFNIQKLNQHKQITLKNYLLQNLEENTPIDFLLLSETRIDEQEYIPNWVKHDSDLNSQYIVFTDHKNPIENFSHSKGTAMIVSKGWARYYQKTFTFPGRFTGVILKRLNVTYFIATVYIPTYNTENTTEFRQLQRYIQNTLASLDENTKIILGGDWNSVLCPQID